MARPARSHSLRLGLFREHRTGSKPTLADCIAPMLEQANLLMENVVSGLALAAAPAGPRRIALFSQAAIQKSVKELVASVGEVGATFQTELSHAVHTGGGAEPAQGELLRYEDLQIFGDAELTQSIEIARAQQEVARASDDVLPRLDALVSSLLGWHTVQPALNPLRPDIYVRALQATLAAHVPDAVVREALIAPAAGLVGSSLATLYRDLADWLEAAGVEPAEPPASSLQGSTNARSGGKPRGVSGTVAKTLITLEKLRKLLAGDLDARPTGDFVHTVPASMLLLQDLEQADALVERLAQRPKLPVLSTRADGTIVDGAPDADAGAPEARAEVEVDFDLDEPDGPPMLDLDDLNASAARAGYDERDGPPTVAPEGFEDGTSVRRPGAAKKRKAKPAPERLGARLGEEVVRLLFDNLAADARLSPVYKRRLRALLPPVALLARGDSRFFSDRNHPARQLLDRLTQRSLGFASERDEGWAAFGESLDHAAARLAERADVDAFEALMADLHARWHAEDASLAGRRRDAARTLLHAEQRNLLAQKYAAEIGEKLSQLHVADFVAAFLKGSWAQVVADAELLHADGTDDPLGCRAIAGDLIWSVEARTGRQRLLRKLAEMIPRLLGQLREGLARIDYPPDLTARFFDHLILLHQAALNEGRAAGAPAPAVDAVSANEAEIDDRAGPTSVLDSILGESDESVIEATALWLASAEARQSGYMVAAAPLVDVSLDIGAAPRTAEAPDASTPSAEPVSPGDPHITGGPLPTGAWVELYIGHDWLRVQLTWASPHGTLFMFMSPKGTAHSMSLRTLERLRNQGLMRTVATRPVVDDALDEVARAALGNSVDGGGEADSR